MSKVLRLFPPRKRPPQGFPANEPARLRSRPDRDEEHELGEAARGMSDLAHSLDWGRDEAELVMELQAGSDAAFEWLVTYFHAAVYNLVYGILADPADAADVTQEVFLCAFRGMRGFRGGSSLKTWLYRISVREALNHRRWCWRHHRNQVSIEADAEREKPALELKDGEATPFEQMAASERQAALRRALGSVPEVFRSAVILRDLEGLSYEEVAEVLGVSVGTVKSRILRGRRALREALYPILQSVQVSTAERPTLTAETFLAERMPPHHRNIGSLPRRATAAFPRAAALAPRRAQGGGQ